VEAEKIGLGRCRSKWIWDTGVKCLDVLKSNMGTFRNPIQEHNYILYLCMQIHTCHACNEQSTKEKG